MKNENTLLIKYTSLFNKQLKSAPLEIKIAFKEVRELFLENPTHPHLRNHLLRELYTGYRSIDITGNFRAFFKITESKSQPVITFHILGTHTQLYG
jgi:mRNA-degrading endonuclease YafQ of YafQ-DinJ toxin-antitoxin module